MSTIPNTPESTETGSYETFATARWIPIVFVILFALVAYLLYAGYTTQTTLQANLDKANQRAELLAKQLDQANGRLAELKGQFEVTSERLGLTQQELARARTLAQTIRKEQQESDAKLVAQIGQVKQESDAKLGQISTEVSGAKTDIEATRKDLEATKTKLERTMGDLGVQSGLIARNHDELDELKRRGERNIYEFDLRKSKSPQKIGPIQVQLKKVDTKRYRYTMDVFADDKRIEKKDKTVNEPVQFYVRGTRVPYEVVVFDLSKDRVVGYLSTPKEGTTATAKP